MNIGGLVIKKALLLSCLVFFLCVPNKVIAVTYYVDGASLGGTCSDSNNGTSIATPWCRVQFAAQTATAGDTVNIRTYTYRETLGASNSGTIGNKITFQAYQNETPVISGADRIANWISIGSQEAGGVFSTGIEVGDNSEFNSVTTTSGNTLDVQSSLVSHGTYAFRATYAGTAENARANKSLTAANDIYGRMYFRVNNSFTIPAADTIHDIFYLRDGTSNNRARVSILANGSGQLYLQARSEAPSTVIVYAGTPGEILFDTWYSIELRYKGGDASTGGVEFWLNDVSKGSNYTQNTSGLQVSRVEIGGNSTGLTQPAAGSVLYMDDLKIATSHIGSFVAEGDAAIYKALNVNWAPSDVYQDTTRLTEVDTLGELTSTGKWYVDTIQDFLYVRTTDDVDPDTHDINATHRSVAIDLTNRSYITLQGLTVKHIRQSAGSGILLSSSTGVSVINSTISQNSGSGIRLIGSTSNTIQGNTFTGNIREFGGGIRLEQGSNSNTISQNTITGLGFSGGNGIFLCGDSTCGSAGNSSNTITQNTISNVRDTCLYLDTDNDANTIERNRCSQAIRRSESSGGNGIHLALGSDNNIIRNNIVYNVERHGISIRAGNDSQGFVSNIGNKILNNTVYNAGTTSGAGINIQSGNTNTTIRNNLVFAAASAPLNVDAESNSSTDSDYNIWYRSDNTIASWAGTTYFSLVQLSAATGQEKHSISRDPRLVNVGGANFALQKESPAINTGISSGDVLSDYDGIGRPVYGAYDIGAFEYGGGIDVSPTPGPTRIPAPVCSTNVSSRPPELFQIDTLSDKAKIYFVPAGNPVTSYYVKYGLTPEANEYGVEFAYSNSDGVITYIVNSLRPGTKYYFSIRAANDCKPGPWSNTMLAVTPGSRQWLRKNFASYGAIVQGVAVTNRKPLSSSQSFEIVPR